MNATSIIALQNELKVATGDHPRRATGPRTEAGLARSSLNAIKNGIHAKCVLMPGEDLFEYESRMTGVFEALAPRNEAEALLVGLIGDDLWRLERLGRVEQALNLARVEELVAQVDE
jgi:hypothetical protein